MTSSLLAENSPYPPLSELSPSPGGITYFVNPSKGSDSASGKSSASAWKTFAPLNQLRLSPGDVVLIAPGTHAVSLKPTAKGSEKKPVILRFFPGIHEFSPANAWSKPIFISNSCDDPTTPKLAGIVIENCQHLRLEGTTKEGKQPPLLLMGGRMAHFINDHSQNISWSNLVFDLKRPTISEFRVREVAENSAVIEIAEGSTFEIKNRKFSWTGDIGSGSVMVQEAIPAEGRAWRIGTQWNPFQSATATQLADKKVRLEWEKGNFNLVKEHQFQMRHTKRDSVGGFNLRSKDISFLDCDFYVLTNMGIVSQYTENLTFKNVRIAPPANTLRTCACWADALHFSGCRGNILVENCRFSGLQDDAINTHGTHLRIIAKTAENQLHMRFMHPQTYGFAAFAPGDEVAVINHKNLCEIPNNPHRRVTAIEPKPGDTSGKEWLLTLDGPAPSFQENDVIDNLTWYPNLIARNNHIELDSCRGFLITTRGTALVEGNTFYRCKMPGVLIEDDANGWYESGPIRNLLIRKNRFIDCGIDINPQTQEASTPVHENIRIEDNFFDGSGISAKSSRALSITSNRFSGNVSVHTQNCQDVKEENNQAKAAK